MSSIIYFRKTTELHRMQCLFALLIEKTKQSYMQYTKHKLNSVYLRKRESQLICEQMRQINLGVELGI